MKTSGRFLLVFGFVILIVVAVAVALSVIGGNAPVKMLSEDTPEGVVQRFLMAVKEGDYAKAYTYLSPLPEDSRIYTYEEWIRSTQSRDVNSSWKASIVKSTVKGNDATVDVNIDRFRLPDSPMTNPVYNYSIRFVLQKENGKWMINSPVDIYWLY